MKRICKKASEWRECARRIELREYVRRIELREYGRSERMDQTYVLFFDLARTGERRAKNKKLFKDG